MLFGKKKEAVDLRDLQRRGVVRIPKNNTVVPTNKEGFVDMRSKVMAPVPKGTASSLFYGKGVVAAKESFSTEKDGYSKREVDSKIIELDNKIYHLEQRIELLERKIGVNQSSYSSYPESNLMSL